MADYGESYVVPVLETVLSGRGISRRINGVCLDVDALGELVEGTAHFSSWTGYRRPVLKRVDFYAAGIQKWLIAPFGVALAYMNRCRAILAV